MTVNCHVIPAVKSCKPCVRHESKNGTRCKDDVNILWCCSYLIGEFHSYICLNNITTCHNGQHLLTAEFTTVQKLILNYQSLFVLLVQNQLAVITLILYNISLLHTELKKFIKKCVPIF